ncbi:MAG: DNA polymerase III subunit gamma/tau [Bacteroides sp.]|nr:DNA polymerase III subunit gamma/tau [Bacteroides sp.]MCM1549945.1 DNA polymerase III subunit gamma/tau [Clostridium sp.]
MSYMALYRKWRPDAFEEVKGQEHIVTTLRNQLTHDRIGHAYLFCGTRGTGKTTVAKLFAKAVNCEQPVEGSPCGSCPSCRSIAEGSSMNVIEIDAASNNGVDNIREIRDEVQYSPAEGRYKVYIIDEVHMLSIGAFNALLKTLEEPPSYVIFILATTEAHKIPITILSRCQRYDFRRISVETIADRLWDLMGREGQQAERKAIDYIARVADGSMRDALSLLDQCISFYLGQELTYEKCLDVLGAVDTEVFVRLLTAVEEKEVTRAVDIIDEVIWQGRELGQFITDFTWFMRNLLLIKSSKEGASRLDFSKENLAAMEQMAARLSLEGLMRYIRIFSELSNSIKYASQKRVVLELAVIKLCVPEMERNYDSILQRIEDLSRKVDTCLEQPKQPVVAQYVQKAVPEEKEESLEELKKHLPEATVKELQEIVAHRAKALELLDPALSSLLKMSDMRLDTNHKSIVVLLDETNQGLLLNNEEDRKAVEDAFMQVTERQVSVEFRKKSPGGDRQQALVSMNIFEEKNIPVEYDDN